jgi:hypothetical protein
MREKSRNFRRETLSIYLKYFKRKSKMELGNPKWNLEFQNETWNSTKMQVLIKGRCASNTIIVDFLCHPSVKIDVEFPNGIYRYFKCALLRAQDIQNVPQVAACQTRTDRAVRDQR